MTSRTTHVSLRTAKNYDSFDASKNEPILSYELPLLFLYYLGGRRIAELDKAMEKPWEFFTIKHHLRSPRNASI